MNARKVKRFEIYLYDFGIMPGSIQQGKRPVLIVQDDQFNKNSPTTIVAAFTSAVKKEYLPSHIFVGERFGLTKPSMVLLEQVRTINQNDLGDYIGTIDDRKLVKVLTNALKKTLVMWSYTPKSSADISCLCPKCLEAYKCTGSYIVRRFDPFQKAKDYCDKCNELGWDYIITTK